MALFGGNSSSGKQDAQKDLEKQREIQRFEKEIKRLGDEQSRRMTDIQRLRDENGRKRQDVMHIQREIADKEAKISELEELNRQASEQIRGKEEAKNTID